MAEELVFQSGDDFLNGSTMSGLFRLLDFVGKDRVRSTVVDMHDQESYGKPFAPGSIL